MYQGENAERLHERLIDRVTPGDHDRAQKDGWQGLFREDNDTCRVPALLGR